MFQTLQSAHDGFYEALAHVFLGDPSKMEDVWSTGDDVTDLGPFSDRSQGSEAVRQQFRAEAAMNLGGRVDITDLHMVESGDMGYTVCVEHGTGHTEADGNPFELHHRCTRVYRREAGGWKLVHQHVDRSSR